MHSIKKLAKLAFFRNYQAFFEQKTSFFFPKNPNLNVWEPLSIKTFRDALSFPWTFAFLKNSEYFSERIQNLNILRILEWKHNLRLTVNQTCQINQFWQKNSSFFPKTPPVFPRNSKVWNFWEFLSKNTIWEAFYRNIANISHFQKG